MNLPYLWLNDYVTIEKDPKTYAARMTMTGSKVEGWQNAADEIQNVVWGKILSIEKHPDALSKTQRHTKAGHSIR